MVTRSLCDRDLAAPTRVSPATATEQKQHQDNDQDSFHVTPHVIDRSWIDLWNDHSQLFTTPYSMKWPRRMSDHIGSLWAICTVLRPWRRLAGSGLRRWLTRESGTASNCGAGAASSHDQRNPLTSLVAGPPRSLTANISRLWATAPQQCFLVSVRTLIKQHLRLRQADVLRNRAKIRPRFALVLGHVLEEQYLALNVDLDQIRLPVDLAHPFTPNLKGPAFFQRGQENRSQNRHALHEKTNRRTYERYEEMWQPSGPSKREGPGSRACPELVEGGPERSAALGVDERPPAQTELFCSVIILRP
jgi:hypothetical protein